MNEEIAPSDLSWVLVGIKSNTGQPLEDSVVQKMLDEAFLEDKTYSLFLCGAEVPDRAASLVEMEEGYKMVLSQMEDFQNGDYCIISTHEEGRLLFMPMKSEDVKNLSGNTDNLS